MNKIYNVFCLIIGLITGLGYSLVITTHDSPKPATPQIVQSPADIKNESLQMETYFHTQVDSLAATNASLAVKASDAKSELQKAKRNNKILLELVDTLIAHSHTMDTAAKLANCDSMAVTMQDMIASSNERDSLYECLAHTLESQLDNRDSAISVQRNEYTCLKLSFDKTLLQQDMLLSQNLHLDKQVKRMKVKNKLLSAGMVIASGIAVYSLLNH